MLPDWSKLKLKPYLASAVILAGVAGVGVWAKGAPAEIPLKIEPAPEGGLATASSDTKNRVDAAPQRLIVHLAGEVQRPGVYELRPNARLVEALRLAGGTRPNAATDRLNLAAPLYDGQKIVVPRRKAPSASVASDLGQASRVRGRLRVAEAEEADIPVVPAAIDRGSLEGVAVRPKAVEPELAMPGSEMREPEVPGREIPGPEIPGPVEPVLRDPPLIVPTPPRGERIRPRSRRVEEPPLRPLSISINSATKTDLERLPGVGPATALKILMERQRRGGFRSVNQLLDVKGIGPAKLAKIRPYVTL